jgi:hypothetical protein
VNFIRFFWALGARVRSRSTRNDLKPASPSRPPVAREWAALHRATMAFGPHLRRSAVVLFVALHGSRAEFSWTEHSAACAKMSDTSNIWPDQTAGFRWKFDLHVTFPLSEGGEFLDKTIKLEWQHPLTIEHVQPQGAVTATGGAYHAVCALCLANSRLPNFHMKPAA